MKIVDWILLALICGYCLWLLLRKKKPKCGGSCGQCRGCGKKSSMSPSVSEKAGLVFRNEI